MTRQRAVGGARVVSAWASVALARRTCQRFHDPLPASVGRPTLVYPLRRAGGPQRPRTLATAPDAPLGRGAAEAVAAAAARRARAAGRSVREAARAMWVGGREVGRGGCVRAARAAAKPPPQTLPPPASLVDPRLQQPDRAQPPHHDPPPRQPPPPSRLGVHPRVVPLPAVAQRGPRRGAAFEARPEAQLPHAVALLDFLERFDIAPRVPRR